MSEPRQGVPQGRPATRQRTGAQCAGTNYVLDIYLDYNFMSLQDREAGYVEVCEFEDDGGNHARECIIGPEVNEVHWHSASTPFLLFPDDPAQWDRYGNEPVFYAKDKKTWAAVASICCAGEEILKLGIKSDKPAKLGYGLYFKPPVTMLKSTSEEKTRKHVLSEQNLVRATIILQA